MSDQESVENLKKKINKFENLQELILEHASKGENFTAIVADDPEKEELFNRAFQVLFRNGIQCTPIAAQHKIELQNYQVIEVVTFDQLHVLPKHAFGSTKGIAQYPAVDSKDPFAHLDAKILELSKEESISDLDSLDVVDRKNTVTTPLAANRPNQGKKK